MAEDPPLVREQRSTKRPQPSRSWRWPAALAGVDPLMAVEISAIVESDAIAPARRIRHVARLAPLVEELPTEIDAARRTPATMSYDDAIAFVFGAIDRLIAEHGADPRT